MTLTDIAKTNLDKTHDDENEALAATTIYVCITCRRAEPSDHAPRPGLLLARATKGAAGGWTIWTFQAKAAVRSAITIGPRGAGAAAYFGDGKANAYAIDAASGDLIWTRTLDDHPSARVTGAPALYENRLYVPIASGEEGQGSNREVRVLHVPRQPGRARRRQRRAACGRRTRSARKPKPIGKNASGTTRWGPSGAGIWSSPTIDPQARVVYAATGNMYTEPQQPTSDAIMAFDLDSGAVKWTAQVTPQDVFVVGCRSA